MIAALLVAGALGLAVASALTPGESLDIAGTYTEFATTSYTTTFDACAALPTTPQPAWITLNGNVILTPTIPGHCEYAPTGSTQYTLTYTYGLSYGFQVGEADVGRILTLAAAIHDMSNTVAVVTGTVTAAPTTTSTSETTTATTTQTAPTATTAPPSTTAPSTTTVATTMTTATVTTTPTAGPRSSITTPATITARVHRGVVTIHIATRSDRAVRLCYRAAALAHRLTCTSHGRAWTIKLTMPKETKVIRRVFSLKTNGRIVAKKTITIKVRRA
jgi:hypothetical protein